jgi:hypothetical protein
LACPDPPAVRWHEVLAAALREADRSDVRRDPYLAVRIVSGDGIDVGRASEFLSLPLREAAEILAAHQRLLWGERTRRRRSWACPALGLRVAAAWPPLSPIPMGSAIRIGAVIESDHGPAPLPRGFPPRYAAWRCRGKTLR